VTEFGRHLLDQWLLDPEVAYLNHGTVGATPKSVLKTQRDWQERIERQPAAVLAREISPLMGAKPRAPGALRAAADRVAAFLGVSGKDLVFVDNATGGVVSVLRSFPLGPGDEIAITDHTYGAVANVARYVAREKEAEVRIAEIPFPARGAQAVIDAFAATLSDKTRIAVLDHAAGKSDAMRGRCAGGNDGHIRAGYVLRYAHIAGRHVDDAAGDEEWRYAARRAARFQKPGEVGLDGLEPADTGPEGNTDPGRVLVGDLEPRVRDGLPAGGDAVMHEPIDLAGLFRRHVVVNVKTADGAAEARREFADVELLDRTDATAARNHGLPCGRQIISYRGNDAETRNDYTPIGHNNRFNWKV